MLQLSLDGSRRGCHICVMYCTEGSLPVQPYRGSGHKAGYYFLLYSFCSTNCSQIVYTAAALYKKSDCEQ